MTKEKDHARWSLPCPGETLMLVSGPHTPRVYRGGSFRKLDINIILKHLISLVLRQITLYKGITKLEKNWGCSLSSQLQRCAEALCCVLPLQGSQPHSSVYLRALIALEQSTLPCPSFSFIRLVWEKKLCPTLPKLVLKYIKCNFSYWNYRAGKTRTLEVSRQL